jgi:hypothetical protein
VRKMAAVFSFTLMLLYDINSEVHILTQGTVWLWSPSQIFSPHPCTSRGRTAVGGGGAAVGLRDRGELKTFRPRVVLTFFLEGEWREGEKLWGWGMGGTQHSWGLNVRPRWNLTFLFWVYTPNFKIPCNTTVY